MDAQRLLALLTLLHFLADGWCGAVLYETGLKPQGWEQLVYNCIIYTFAAFGLQPFLGWLLDRFPQVVRGSFILSAAFLLCGMLLAGRGAWGSLLLGLGNSLFHVAGGKTVLAGYGGYSSLGIFVASGALGLGLGTGGYVGSLYFALAYLVLSLYASASTVLVQQEARCTASGSETRPLLQMAVMGCAAVGIMLRGCIGSVQYDSLPLLLPAVFCLGKTAGGICGDFLGFRRTILLVFLGSFLTLQAQGLAALLLFIFLCNMTMPLTLRLFYESCPQYPGAMFGLAAACLLPPFYWQGWRLTLPAFITLQFVILFWGGRLLRRLGADKGREGR